jgi:hypothetical protein
MLTTTAPNTGLDSNSALLQELMHLDETPQRVAEQLGLSQADLDFARPEDLAVYLELLEAEQGETALLIEESLQPSDCPVTYTSWLAETAEPEDRTSLRYYCQQISEIFDLAPRIGPFPSTTEELFKNVFFYFRNLPEYFWDKVHTGYITPDIKEVAAEFADFLPQILNEKVLKSTEDGLRIKGRSRGEVFHTHASRRYDHKSGATSTIDLNIFRGTQLLLSTEDIMNLHELQMDRGGNSAEVESFLKGLRQSQEQNGEGGDELHIVENISYYKGKKNRFSFETDMSYFKSKDGVRHFYVAYIRDHGKNRRFPVSFGSMQLGGTLDQYEEQFKRVLTKN